jgi:Pyridoxal phosphate biosynthesis protein
MKKIAISPGDPAGVGPDICLKAFKKNINQDSHPVFFGDPNLFEERAKFLNIDIDIEEYENGDELDQNIFYVKPHQLNSKITPGNPDPNYAEY